jgi:phosphosulfolactate phosphohydrolase-like enzyme
VAHPTFLLKHHKHPLSVRQFGDGATDAAKEKGISVIIDNFRASNTILILLEAGAMVRPVELVEEALTYTDAIKVGEQKGKRHPLFDYDNSPAFFNKNRELVKDQNVVIRTVNGTRGIIKALGSEQILVGAFRNLSAIVKHCVDFVSQGIPVSFVAMGSKEISRIEDVYGAKMMFYKIVEMLDYSDPMLETSDNPWNSTDWVLDIIADRKISNKNKDDRLLALQLDKSIIIPIYNETTGKLEILDPSK